MRLLSVKNGAVLCLILFSTLLSVAGTQAQFGDYYDRIQRHQQERYTSEADDVAMSDIITETAKCTDCISYKVTGVCFWLKCTLYPPSCQVLESILVEHYLPDFVVSVFSNETPFELGIMPSTDTGSITVDETAQYSPDSNVADTNLDFKQAEIVVNPAILAYNAMAESFGYSCQSTQSIPLQPMYASTLDPAWEAPIIEQYYPQALTGFPRMSEAPEYWGPIYPRTGWNSLQHDSLASLVAAERAAEILTGGFSAHVFFPPGNDCGNKCWAPPKVAVGDDANGFQMIYPFVDDDSKPLPRHGSWSRGMETPDERYTWVLWRRYECCDDRGSFIGRVEID